MKFERNIVAKSSNLFQAKSLNKSRKLVYHSLVKSFAPCLTYDGIFYRKKRGQSSETIKRHYPLYFFINFFIPFVQLFYGS